GQVVVRYARQLARLERDAHAALGMGPDDGATRVTAAVNADSLATWFLDALARVPQDPPIAFELHREDETRTAELLREGLVMAAVTSSPDAVAGCSVRLLGRMRYLAAATPEFARRHLDGPPGERLAAAPVMTFDRSDVLQDRFVRSIGGPGAQGVRHAMPTSEGFVAAVADGLGWGVLPEAQVEPLLDAGRLVLLAPDRPVDVPLYWQQWKLDSPALAALTESVTAVAARALRP
ncbi:ArgP/LysG family DNA-binding transcriptional regulator, partial [Streptomyces sp. SID5785]|uniref:ArgP/LysG family DNA-binding transcriptional regulator n=1 Tax=Streptomyces sp. SID5785 TaxID=2690309 RepID=UPI0013614C1F